MAQRRPDAPENGVRPEINVTPLVDVVLVLLIIFMVVAPRLEQDVQVYLPGIYHPDPDVDALADAFKVTVARGGEYFIDNQRYDLDDAIEHLGDAHAAEPLRRLILRADADLPYGDVRELFARAQKVGFPGMALMVGEKHRHDEPVANRPSDPKG
jgi:biopolymer transport protein ExbD